MGDLGWEVFLPGESTWTEGPGRLQSRGHKELDMTERLPVSQADKETLYLLGKCTQCTF